MLIITQHVLTQMYINNNNHNNKITTYIIQMRLSFQQVFKDAYAIYMDNDQRVGFFTLLTHNTVDNLDISVKYFDIIKHKLLDNIMLELGIDGVYIVKNKENNYWYKRLGFCDNDKKGYLVYPDMSQGV